MTCPFWKLWKIWKRKRRLTKIRVQVEFLLKGADLRHFGTAPHKTRTRKKEIDKSKITHCIQCYQIPLTRTNSHSHHDCPIASDASHLSPAFYLLCIQDHTGKGRYHVWKHMGGWGLEREKRPNFCEYHLGEPSNKIFGNTWDFVPTKSPPGWDKIQVFPKLFFEGIPYGKMQAEGSLPTKSFAAKRLEKQMSQDTVWFEEPGSQSRNQKLAHQTQPAEGSVWHDQPQEVWHFEICRCLNILKGGRGNISVCSVS